MQWHAPLNGKRGPNYSDSDAAIQCCLSLKVLLNLPLPPTIGLVASLIKLSGLPWTAPHFSTLRRRQKDSDVNVRYTPSPLGLH